MTTRPNEDSMFIGAVLDAESALKRAESQGSCTVYFNVCDRYRAIILAQGLNVNQSLYGSGRAILGREDVFSPEQDLVDLL